MYSSKKGEIMGFVDWFYRNIFKREYPLVCIPRFPLREVPYSDFWFGRQAINLILSKKKREEWGIVYDEEIDFFVEDILEHEYLHITINKVAGHDACSKLNNVNRLDLSTYSLIWAFRDGKTFGHIEAEAKKIYELNKGLLESLK